MMTTLALCQNPLCPKPNREFEQTRKNNTYCSPACRQAALRNRQKESQETFLDQRLRKLPISVASMIKSMSEEHSMEAAMQALSAVNLLLNIADAWPKEVRELIGPDQEKMVELETELARYRQICDMTDRKRLEDRFMGLGAAFHYHRLINYNVQPGEEAWRAFLYGADDSMLAEALVHGEAFYQNWMGFVEATDLKKTEKRIAELEQTIQRYVIADQKAKEAITEMQQGTSRSGNRIDALEQELARANKMIERYEPSQREMNDAEDQRLRELRRAFLELGECQSYQPMSLTRLRTICLGLVEDIGEGKDRWEWASESLDQGSLMVVLAAAMSMGQGIDCVQDLEQKLEEEQANFACLRDEYMLATKKIATLERHVQRFELMGTLRSRTSMLQELMVLGGRLKYCSLTDLDIREGIDQWLNFIRGLNDEDLAKAIAHGYWQADSLAMAAVAASDTKVAMQMRQQINDLMHDIVLRDSRIRELESGQGQEAGDVLMRQQLERQVRKIAELECEMDAKITRMHKLDESHGSTMSHMNMLLAQSQSRQQELEAKLAEQAAWVAWKEADRQEQDRLQLERELDAVRSENQEMQRELTRYVPPPRSLLECTLRQWCKLTNVFLHEKPLVGKDLDAYIGAFSNRRLLSSIQSAESCYFLDKHRRRRIGVIAEAIEQGRELLYQGDRDLVLRSIDAQGLVTLATGMQCWLNTDDVEQFWALLVAEAGQQHVGGNGAVSSLQQYLCEHPGQSLPLGRGKDDQHLILIDDDRLAVTTRRKPKKLYEDDLEQAWRWVKQQS